MAFTKSLHMPLINFHIGKYLSDASTVAGHIETLLYLLYTVEFEHHLNTNLSAPDKLRFYAMKTSKTHVICWLFFL